MTNAAPQELKVNSRVTDRSGEYTGTIVSIGTAMVATRGDRYGTGLVPVLRYSVDWDGVGVSEGYRAGDLTAAPV